jgi:hypothetical protein
MLTGPSSGARALRARRSAHQSRKWARCARERIVGAGAQRLWLSGSSASRPSMGGSHKLLAGPSMLSPIPVMPEEGRATNEERVEQHAHLTRFGSCFTIPLTLLAQRAGAATMDAGGIHHTQAAIGFLAPLIDTKRLPSRTAQRPIWLEGKVATRKASLFPGRGDSWRSISCYRRWDVGRLCSEPLKLGLRHLPCKAQADLARTRWRNKSNPARP